MNDLPNVRREQVWRDGGGNEFAVQRVVSEYMGRRLRSPYVIVRSHKGLSWSIRLDRFRPGLTTYSLVEDALPDGAR